MSIHRMNAPQNVTELNLSLARIDNETTAAVNSAIENLAQSMKVLKAAADYVTEVTPDSGSAGVMPKIPEHYRSQVGVMRDHANALRKALHDMRKTTDLMVRLHEEAQAKARHGRVRSQMAGRRSI